MLQQVGEVSTRGRTQRDMTYCTIREITQGMFQTPNMHTVLLRYGKNIIILML